MAVVRVGVTIARGRQVWRLVVDQWQVRSFGWWPTGRNPRWGWADVDADVVPGEVRRCAAGMLPGRST